MGSSQAVLPCPLKKHVIEALVVDQFDEPLNGIVVRLSHGDQETRTRTGPDGTVRFEGLPEADYSLTLLDFDKDAWTSGEATALHPELREGRSEPEWQARQDPVQPPDEYTVGADDDLMLVAGQYGFWWETLWKADGNAKLAKARKTPFVREGDVLAVPRRRVADVAAVTGKRYYFRLSAVKRLLRLRFLHADGKPRSEEPYICAIGLKSGEIAEHRLESTDDDGFLEETVPVDAVSLEVTIGKTEEEQQVYRIWVTKFAPADDVEGLQTRLHALGYYAGAMDGELGPVTKEALAGFQSDVGIEPTGEPDEATVAKLSEIFGS